MKKLNIRPEGGIKKTSTSNPILKFSFKFFDQSDDEMCPAVFKNGYTQTLMGRLQGLSSWTVADFTGRENSSIRNHRHDWSKTSRPRGFSHLNDHYSAYEGWQFCLSANEYGRVHGIIIDDTFYVIWLDQDHRMYP
jgi:hypothetical protein